MYEPRGPGLRGYFLFARFCFPRSSLAAGVIGLVGGKLWRDKFLVIERPSGIKPPWDDKPATDGADHELRRNTQSPSLARAECVSPRRVLCPRGGCQSAVGVVWRGWGAKHTIFTQEGVFFSKAAMVTFGGAYAVLPYVAQQAVQHFQWLHPGQMMDGLGLAETTPGPLIMVLQFVGFLGAWNHPGGLPPSLAAATLGAAFITTWTHVCPLLPLDIPAAAPTSSNCAAMRN